jgi:hypothetical protein
VSVRRPELVLAGAVALCAPMIPGVLDGNVSAVAAGGRFLVAIIICWCAGSLLTSLTDRYSREARRTQAIRMLAAARRPPGAGDGSGPPVSPAE